jgi:Leucine-rich repeat (LRR) protein
MKISEDAWKDLLAKIKDDLYLGESLDLSHQDLTHADISVLLDVLEKSTHIKHLDLSDNDIEDEGAIELAEKNKTVSSLELQDNWIRDVGAIALATKKILIYLGLGRNDIGDASAIKFSRNEDLSFLNIEGNHIGDVGAIALAEKNKTLDSLNLRGNRVGSEGAIALLEKNKTLRFLDLSNNEIDDKGDEGAIALLEVNKTLHFLELGSNGLSGDIEQLAKKQSVINSRQTPENKFEFLRFLCKSKNSDKFDRQSQICSIIFKMAGVSRPTEEELKEQEEKVDKLCQEHHHRKQPKYRD